MVANYSIKMSTKLTILVVLLFTLASCLAQCPAISVQQPFDVNQYVGLWYSVERVPLPQESDLQCTTAKYATLPNGNLQVENAGFYANGTYSVLVGEAVPQESLEVPSFDIYFPNSPHPEWPGNYNVLETDYVTYSLVFSCHNFTNPDGSPYRYDAAWILSRRKTLDNGTVIELETVLEGYGIALSRLQKVEQNCDN